MIKAESSLIFLSSVLVFTPLFPNRRFQRLLCPFVWACVNRHAMTLHHGRKWLARSRDG